VDPNIDHAVPIGNQPQQINRNPEQGNIDHAVPIGNQPQQINRNPEQGNIDHAQPIDFGFALPSSSGANGNIDHAVPLNGQALVSAAHQQLTDHLNQNLSTLYNEHQGVVQQLDGSLARSYNKLEDKAQTYIDKLNNHLTETGIQNFQQANDIGIPLQAMTPDGGFGQSNVPMGGVSASPMGAMADTTRGTWYPYLDCATPAIIIADDTNKYLYDGNPLYQPLPPSNDTKVNTYNALYGQLQQLVMQYCIASQQQQTTQQQQTQQQQNQTYQQTQQQIQDYNNWLQLQQQQQQQLQQQYQQEQQQSQQIYNQQQNNNQIDYNQINQILQQNAQTKSNIQQQLQQMQQQQQTQQQQTQQNQQGQGQSAQGQGQQQQQQQSQGNTANTDQTNPLNAFVDQLNAITNALNNNTLTDFNGTRQQLLQMLQQLQQMRLSVVQSGQDPSPIDQMIAGVNGEIQLVLAAQTAAQAAQQQAQQNAQQQGQNNSNLAPYQCGIDFPANLQVPPNYFPSWGLQGQQPPTPGATASGITCTNPNNNLVYEIYWIPQVISNNSTGNNNNNNNNNNNTVCVHNYEAWLDCTTGKTLLLSTAVPNTLPNGDWRSLGNISTTDLSTVEGSLAQLLAVAAPCPHTSTTIPDDPLPDQNLADPCAQFQGLLVGSPEWCELLDKISLAFAKLGQQLVAMMVMYDILADTDCASKARDKEDNYKCPLDKDIAAVIGSSAVNPGGGSGIGSVITGSLTNPLGISGSDIAGALLGSSPKIVEGMAYGVMRGIGFDKQTACNVAQALDPAFLLRYLRETMCTVFSGLAKCSVCNPIVVSGLVFVKGMLGFLKHLRGDFVAGIDFIGKAGIKIAFHLPIEITPVIHVVDYLLEWACPTKLPSEGEITELALRQEITTDHYSTLTRLHGLSPYFAQKVLHAKREKLSSHEVIEYFKRHPELPDNTDNKLMQMGFIDDDERHMVKDLYVEIPDINRHFEWLRRNADSPIFVAEFGLWQGFDTRENVIALYKEMLTDPTVSQERKGEIEQAIPIIATQVINPALATRNYWNTYGTDIQAKGWTKKNTFYAYVAHFLPVPREMGYEFVQRLRQGRVPEQLVFTQNTLRRVLNEQDIDPNMIDRYIYCSYRTLNQRYIQMLAKLGLVDEAEIGERLQDIGFDPASSKILANGLWRQRKQQVATEVHGWNAANILQKYKAHLITKAVATEKLQYLGFTDADIADAFEVASLEKVTDLKKEWTNTIKKCYLRGVVNYDTAYQDLLRRGVESQQAKDLLELWDAEKVCDVHMLSASEDVKLTKEGVLTIEQLALRLTNLNYSNDSIAGVLAGVLLDMQREIDKENAKQQAEQDREQAKQQKELATQLKDRQREKQALQKEIEKQLAQQKKLKAAQDTIKLNLAKAIAKAQARVQKAKIREQQKALALAEKDAQRKAKMQAQKDYLSSVLDAKTSLQNVSVDIKNKASLAKASTSDKMQKQEIAAQAATDINTQKTSFEQHQLDAKVSYNQSMADATSAEPSTVPIVTTDPTIQEAQQAAAQETTIAKQEAAIKEEGLN